MEILNQLAKVDQSPTHQEWKSGMPKAFLSSMFVLIDGQRKDWQAAYYDPDSQHTTAFVIGNPVTLIPPSPTFKEPGAIVYPLEIGKVTFDLQECLTLVAERQKKEFPAAVPSKIIAILQHLPVGLVYNVTYVTTMLSTLNMKVDAVTKEIKDAKLIPIVSFPKK